MQATASYLRIIIFAALLSVLGIAQAPAPSSTSLTQQEVRFIEVKFEREPLLAVTLSDPISTQSDRPFTYKTTALVKSALYTEDGELLIPIGTPIPLTISITPGKFLRGPGEAVISVDPFLIGRNIPGAVCEPNDELTLDLLLCQSRWKLALSNTLAYAQLPDYYGGGRTLHVHKGREGLTGSRTLRRPQFNDYVLGDTSAGIQSLSGRHPTTSLIYEAARPLAGLLRIGFSRRDLYLPPETKILFRVGQIIQLSRFDRTSPQSVRLYNAPPNKSSPTSRVLSVTK